VHSETASEVELGLKHMLALATAAPSVSRRRYESVVRVSRQHLNVLSRFGRYPHRNRILGRPTTPEETEFLATSRLGFMLSVLPVSERGTSRRVAGGGNPAAASGRKQKQKQQKKRKGGGNTARANKRGSKRAPQRILLLHSFRQSAVTLRKATKKLRLALNGIADIGSYVWCAFAP